MPKKLKTIDTENVCPASSRRFLSIIELLCSASWIWMIISAILFIAMIVVFGLYCHNYAERLGLNKWDWVAIIIATVSLGVALWAAILQYKTEKNTMKITVEGQFDLLIDYFRHFYANLIVVLAVYNKLGKQYLTGYPSEEHFRKLTVELDVLHPEAFFHSKEKYNSIHNLYLLIRNFNEECMVAEKHLCDKNVCQAAKDRDLNTLIFKQDYFVKRFSECIFDLCKSSGCSQKSLEKAENKWRTYLLRAHDDILERAFERNKKELIDHKLFKGLNKKEENLSLKERADLLKQIIEQEKIPNYWNQVSKSNFVQILFKNDSDMFRDLLNYNVFCEINGKNSQGYDKIFILPFE